MLFFLSYKEKNRAYDEKQFGLENQKLPRELKTFECMIS